MLIGLTIPCSNKVCGEPYLKAHTFAWMTESFALTWNETNFNGLSVGFYRNCVVTQVPIVPS